MICLLVLTLLRLLRAAWPSPPTWVSPGLPGRGESPNQTLALLEPGFSQRTLQPSPQEAGGQRRRRGDSRCAAGPSTQKGGTL